MTNEEIKQRILQAASKARAAGRKIVDGVFCRTDGICPLTALGMDEIERFTPGTTDPIFRHTQHEFGWNKDVTWDFVNGFDGIRNPLTGISDEAVYAMGQQVRKKLLPEQCP